MSIRPALLQTLASTPKFVDCEESEGCLQGYLHNVHIAICFLKKFVEYLLCGKALDTSSL